MDIHPLFSIKCNLQLIYLYFLYSYFGTSIIFLCIVCTIWLRPCRDIFYLPHCPSIFFYMHIYIYIYIRFLMYQEEATTCLRMQINLVFHSIRQININLLIWRVNSKDLLMRMLKRFLWGEINRRTSTGTGNSKRVCCCINARN